MCMWIKDKNEYIWMKIWLLSEFFLITHIYYKHSSIVTISLLRRQKNRESIFFSSLDSQNSSRPHPLPVFENVFVHALKCTILHLWNYLHNQISENIDHFLECPAAPLYSLTPTLVPSVPPICFLEVQITLHFLKLT